MVSHRGDLLLVEDDPQLRTLFHAILTQSGYSVRSAHDELSGLAEIRNAAPDLVFSDLHMPGMSGFDFLSEVRKRFSEIPLVAMSSAYSGNEVPAGVVADAFYDNATSISTVLGVVASTRSELIPFAFGRQPVCHLQQRNPVKHHEAQHGGK